VIPVLLAGAGVGTGLWLVWRSVTARTTLADIDAALARPGRPASVLADPSSRDQIAQRTVRAVSVRLARMGFDPAARSTDLAVTRTTVEQHVAAKLTWALIGAGTSGLFAVVFLAAGLPIVPLPIFLFTAVLGVGGFFVPDLGLAQRAKEARVAFRHAYGAYLDLVDVMIAAGAGPESALQNAADSGDGWSFAQIREALDAARRSRNQSVWAALGDLGTRIDVRELGQLAASASLVDTEGARIRESVAAQAETLRAAQLAEVEAAAESATERMSVPVVVLLAGFVLFIGFPAVYSIANVGT
jgi:Flp pilus assembly protein TadB